MRKGSVSYEDFKRVILSAKRLPKLHLSPCLEIPLGVVHFLTMPGTGLMEVKLNSSDYNDFRLIFFSEEKRRDLQASRIN